VKTFRHEMAHPFDAAAPERVFVAFDSDCANVRIVTPVGNHLQCGCAREQDGESLASDGP
jgi:hypothetical protein